MTGWAARTYRTWKPAWKAVTASLHSNLDTYGLRDFTVSALISGGASVKKVQTVLGHSFRGNHTAGLHPPMSRR